MKVRNLELEEKVPSLHKFKEFLVEFRLQDGMLYIWSAGLTIDFGKKVDLANCEDHVKAILESQLGSEDAEVVFNDIMPAIRHFAVWQKLTERLEDADTSVLEGLLFALNYNP